MLSLKSYVTFQVSSITAKKSPTENPKGTGIAVVSADVGVKRLVERTAKVNGSPL
jgi:hypothetical protein